mgnify:CR=1 FL=1
MKMAGRQRAALLPGTTGQPREGEAKAGMVTAGACEAATGTPTMSGPSDLEVPHLAAKVVGLPLLLPDTCRARGGEGRAQYFCTPTRQPKGPVHRPQHTRPALPPSGLPILAAPPSQKPAHGPASASQRMLLPHMLLHCPGK